jgi:hypothetical protein
METETLNRVSVVVTRYNEYIDWISYIIDKVDTVHIYNKGPNENFFRYFDPKNYPEKIKIHTLENVGRIDHTLTHHILENWDTLPEVLVNLPGSIMMCERKGYYLNAIMKRIGLIKSRYSGFFGPKFHKVSPKFNYNIDNYQAEGACNRNSNPFIKSEYQDFQAWKTSLVDTRPMRYVTMRGMFAVSKENVQHIDRGVYERIRTSLSVGDNIENGHFAERIWAHLFRQYSFDNKVIVQPAQESGTDEESGTNEEKVTVLLSGTQRTVSVS